MSQAHVDARLYRWRSSGQIKIIGAGIDKLWIGNNRIGISNAIQT